MSYLHYIACSHELPCGRFGAPPKAVYESYAAYSNSADYRLPTGLLGPLPYSEIEERRRIHCRAQGAVLVYEKLKDMHGGFSITPLSMKENDENTQRIFSHFTLPFVYFTRGLSLDYLCKYLHPYDCAQYLRIWNDEEAPPRCSPDLYINLQDYIDGTLTEQQIYKTICPKLSNAFVHFAPPKEPHPELPIRELELPDYTFSVCLENGSEFTVLHKMQRQGLF